MSLRYSQRSQQRSKENPHRVSNDMVAGTLYTRCGIVTWPLFRQLFSFLIEWWGWGRFSDDHKEDRFCGSSSLRSRLQTDVAWVTPMKQDLTLVLLEMGAQGETAASLESRVWRNFPKHARKWIYPSNAAIPKSESHSPSFYCMYLGFK